MNTPTHIVAGICGTQVVVSELRRFGFQRRSVIWLACFGVAIASHLVLDLLPHYAWIVYLSGYESLPFHWLVREAIVAGIVMLPAIYFTRRIWPYAIAGVIGGLYPDIEKVASVDFHLPERFVIFRWHSMQLSAHHAGLPRSVLITAEVVLITVLLLGTWRLGRGQGKGREDVR